MEYLVKEDQQSSRKACTLIGISLTTCEYKATPKDDGAVQQALTKITTKHAIIGFWSFCYRLWDKGHPLNHKHSYRVYTDMKRNIRRSSKKRLPERIKLPSTVPHHRTRCGSLTLKVKASWTAEGSG